MESLLGSFYEESFPLFLLYCPLVVTRGVFSTTPLWTAPQGSSAPCCWTSVQHSGFSFAAVPTTRSRTKTEKRPTFTHWFGTLAPPPFYPPTERSRGHITTYRGDDPAERLSLRKREKPWISWRLSAGVDVIPTNPPSSLLAERRRRHRRHTDGGAARW